MLRRALRALLGHREISRRASADVPHRDTDDTGFCPDATI